ncbi:MAG: radical SAM protein [Clostridia bacterium]|nr:radical SAM protein [Clostridia bacterium]
MKTLKERHLDELAAYHETLCREPKLRHLFLELTLRCNANCFHCGSNCTPDGGEGLTLADYRRILDEVKADFDISKLMLCITGGEPLLRHDFFEIMEYAHALGYNWGMTSNATLIDETTARRLAETGMKTISVSIDGLRETHDDLRGMVGGFDRAMRGVQNLIDVRAFQNVQITTVFNHRNIKEIDALFDLMKSVDIDSWRVAALEPIGRALSRPELMLTPDDVRALMDFVREKRRQGWPVEYGCSHYLGLGYEAEVRDWYWLCNAGVYTASIMENGDVGACLDIERRPETVFGNVKTRRFSEIWKNGFGIFRGNLGEKSETCRACPHLKYCRGDAAHSWNFDENEPMVCYRHILFD